MPGRLQGRVAIVTGGGGGIGRTVAALMAKEGASVVVNDVGSAVDGVGHSSAAADEVVAGIIAGGGTAIASYESVSEHAAAQDLVASAINSFGRLDIVCHAAGILRDRMIFNMTEDEWDQVISVHLGGAYNIVSCAAPLMASQGYGRIVLLASISGLRSSGQANYAAAKEGMVGLARSAAADLADRGVTVNAVYPGGRTRMTASIPESAAPLRAGGDPRLSAADVLGTSAPEEALDPSNNAAKIVHLCTEAAGSITGQVISTTGWDMSLYSRRRPIGHVHTEGEWTVDELVRLLPISLAAGVTNPAPPQPSR